MATTTKEDIRRWFESGKSQKATHMIIVCDTYDHEDYPVFVNEDQDVKEREAYYEHEHMQRVMEVYNLSMNMDEQLIKSRNFQY